MNCAFGTATVSEVPYSFQTFLAFDFGTKKIGTAIGGRLLKSAQSLNTIAAVGEKRFDRISDMIDEWKPDALVVGIPYHPDGESHENTLKAKRFGRQLNGRFRLSIFEVDERDRKSVV